MLGRSTRALIFIRVCIWGLRSVAPISIAYTLLRLFFLPKVYRLPLPFEIWLGAETVFYLCFYLPRKHHILQRPILSPRLNPEVRRDLFLKCTALIKNPEAYISRWCRDAPLPSIRRGNLKDFLCWAFLGGVNPITIEEEEELEWYIAETESTLKEPLQPGVNGDVKPLRLTMDAVKMSHRSLLWYNMVAVVDILASSRMMYNGFTLFPTADWFGILPGRPHTLLTIEHSPVRSLSYWYRPHKSRTKLPIVFLHGIGVGVYPYTKFLCEISSAEPDVGIIVVEYMPISMRITKDALQSTEYCRQVERILAHHKINKFVLIGHSYGTFQATYFLHCPELSPRIDGIVLIDPVCFLLHLPEVAYNFTSRPPSTANEFQLEYFASLDPGIAHTFYRNFFWTENILWKEDLEPVRRCGIVIGGKDMLTDSNEVWKYLTGREVSGISGNVDRWESEDSGRRNISSGRRSSTALFFKDCDHAQVFDTRSRREHIVAMISDFCCNIPIQIN